MKRSALTILAIVAGFSGVASCMQSSDGTAARSDQLINTGNTFFNTRNRFEYLSRNDCRPYRPDALASFSPAVIDGAAGWSAFSKQPRQFAAAVNGHAMQYLNTQNTKYADLAIVHLKRFADADAFRLSGDINATAYAIGQVLNFLLPAWQILRASPNLTDDDRHLIEAWLIQLLDRNQREQPAPNNHLTSMQMNLVMAGALFDRPQWFNRGIERGYKLQIKHLRQDGSWPLEAERGQLALVYTSRNIAHLMVIAETARQQGVDLYAYQSQGRTIHDAIQFMLNAQQNNSLIDGYAQANMWMPDDYQHFRGNAQVNPFKSHDTSWIPIYAHRFPNSDITKQLRQLKPKTGNQGIHFSAVGGNVTCLIGY